VCAMETSAEGAAHDVCAGPAELHSVPLSTPPSRGGAILCRRFAPPCSTFRWCKGIFALPHEIVSKKHEVGAEYYEKERHAGLTIWSMIPNRFLCMPRLGHFVYFVVSCLAMFPPGGPPLQESLDSLARIFQIHELIQEKRLGLTQVVLQRMDAHTTCGPQRQLHHCDR
jgi:hypothetical protein